MNEEPKSFWRRSWTGWRGLILWFVLVAVATFILVFTFGLLSHNGLDSDAVPIALLCAAVAVMVMLTFKLIRWLCCWRNARRFFFGAACFFTLIVLAYAVENFRGKRAWEKHKQELEAKGEKFSIPACAPPPVPDEKNFALTPLLRPALEFTRGPEGIIRRDTNGYARLENLRPDVQMPDSTNSLALGSFDKGTLADLEACRIFYRGNTNYPQPTKAGTAAEDILVALSRFDPEMKELREAVATRPYSRFPIEYDYEPSIAILLPHLVHIKSLCRLVHVRAIAELELGRPADALADLQVAFRISDSINAEPILIDHLVRIATIPFNLQTVREGLVRHAWSDAQLAELEKYLASLNVLAEYKVAMRGERAFGTSCLDYMRRHPSSMESFGGLDESEASVMPGGGMMPGGWFYQNMVTISQMHQNFTLPAVNEQTHRIFPEEATKLEKAISDSRVGPYNIFMKLLMPALSKAMLKSARAQFYVDAARVACALERHRLATGKLADSLDELSPKFLEKIPDDVANGKPLQYQKNSDGSYVIYSVGWNLKDDGGETGLGKRLNVDAALGDWVWKMPAK